MRVSSISYAQPRNLVCKPQTHVMKRDSIQTQQLQNPNFRGWGGFFGTIAGAGAGLLLTAATGGLAAGLIPVLAGSAAIGGEMYVEKDRPTTDKYGM